MAVSCKGAHFPKDGMLTCVRWYVAYPLSTRHVEELSATCSRCSHCCAPQN
jgi:transposase-like protein